MDKGDLIKFLEPFADEIEIVIECEGSFFNAELEYDPSSYDDYAAIVIKALP